MITNNPNFIEVVEFQSFPDEIVKGLTVHVNSFPLTKLAQSYAIQANYVIFTQNAITKSVKPFRAGTLEIPQEVVAMWGDDDNVVINYVLLNLGLTRKDSEG